MPTPELAAEVRHLFDLRYSASSKSSIAAALVHWNDVCDRYLWPDIIQTGDPTRGAKLCVLVLQLVGHTSMYPSSTISNYVWALCAHVQLDLQADPRVNVIGWPFFMTSVTVLCYVPGEPRKRVPTSLIRDALAAVDHADFVQVQTALLVLFLYFTFQRSELPCPKTYDGLDPRKHLFVKHMQPHDGGSRWAVGTTKADPRAERLSNDAGPGREWIVVGEVDDELFDMRTWLALFYAMLPPGPRLPDSPFFVSRDKTRPLIYSQALPDLRTFLRNGGCDNPDDFGLHGIRSEAFITCARRSERRSCCHSRRVVHHYHRVTVRSPYSSRGEVYCIQNGQFSRGISQFRACEYLYFPRSFAQCRRPRYCRRTGSCAYNWSHASRRYDACAPAYYFARRLEACLAPHFRPPGRLCYL